MKDLPFMNVMKDSLFMNVIKDLVNEPNEIFTVHEHIGKRFLHMLAKPVSVTLCT